LDYVREPIMKTYRLVNGLFFVLVFIEKLYASNPALVGPTALIAKLPGESY
jgi:hypothetical protein